DDAAGHLLDPEDERTVVLTRADRSGGQHERGAAARAPCLHVDDGDAGAADRSEHLVAGGDARVRRSAEGGLKLRVARDTQRLPDRGHAEIGQGWVREPAEGVDAGASDLDRRGHGPAGAKVYVMTSVPSSSVCNDASANRTGAPKVRRDGSASSMREMTRTPSGSSTTPNPYGTSPR